MRTFLGKSDFYWPLMLLAEQWQCSLYANVLFVQSSVPTMFLHFLANGRVTNRRVPPFPIFEHVFFPCLKQTLILAVEGFGGTHGPPTNPKGKACTWTNYRLYGMCVYIYIHIYMHAVELKLVQDLGVYKLKTGPSYKFKTGPSLFTLPPPIFIVFWGMFINTNSINFCQNSFFYKIVGMSKMRCSKRKMHFFVFFILLQEKQKKEKTK